MLTWLLPQQPSHRSHKTRTRNDVQDQAMRILGNRTHLVDSRFAGSSMFGEHPFDGDHVVHWRERPENQPRGFWSGDP